MLGTQKRGPNLENYPHTWFGVLPGRPEVHRPKLCKLSMCIVAVLGFRV